MLRNKLTVAIMGVAAISLVAGGGAGYWFAHKKKNLNRGWKAKNRIKKFFIGTIQ